MDEKRDTMKEASEGSTRRLPASGRDSSRRGRAMVEGSMWTAGVLLVVALIGMLNYFGLKYYQRWDWTGSKLYSLSEKTLSVLKGLDHDVDATMLLQPGTSNVFDDAKELLERYAAKSSHFHFRVVDPQRNLAEAKQLVNRYKLTSLNVIVFESGDERRTIQQNELADWDYSGMQYGQQPTMKGFKGEEAFTGAILSLEEKTKPKVLFTTGHGERSLEDSEAGGLSRVHDLLGQENLDLQSWASLGKKDVPADTGLLVIAGPKTNFVPPELEAFDRYLDGGGRMLVLLDPELDSEGGLAKTGLESWLTKRGVDVDDDLVVDPTATLPFYGAETIFVSATGTSPIVKALEEQQTPVIFALARSVRAGSVPADLEATTLLETTSSGWGETDLKHLRAVEKGSDDVAGPVPVGVAVAANEKKANPEEAEMEEENPAAKPKPPATDAQKPKWRLVVYGDSDFASNGDIENVGNPTLVTNTFDWLLQRKHLLGIGPKKPEQVRLTLTRGQLRAITLGTLAGLPALSILAGFAVWFRRRR